MQTFVVDADAFFASFPPHPKATEIESAIKQLIERFEIRDKDILSIGSGAAVEERWFWHHGRCRLTLLDRDEINNSFNFPIEPRLKNLPAAEAGLVFHLGSAEEILNPRRLLGFRRAAPQLFDAVYASSFTPDESRRHAIMTRGPWRLRDDPLHSLIMEGARMLRPGGFLIVQSYASGIDVKVHSQFLPAMSRQMNAIDIDLLEAYRFRNTTGVNIFIGRKSSSSSFTCRAPLDRFHGRAHIVEPIEQTWPNSILAKRAAD